MTRKARKSKFWLATAVQVDAEPYRYLKDLCKERGLPYRTVQRHIKDYGYFLDGSTIIQRKSI